MQKIQAKIHLGSIVRNARAFQGFGTKKLCAVVKANAYGHGAEEVVNALEGEVHFFAVALLEEGVAVKTAACGKEILIFTPPTDEKEAFLLIKNGFLATVPDMERAKLIADVCERYRLPIKVHLKINTGMNRSGMDLQTLQKVCTFLKEKPLVRVTGIYSHLFDTTIQSANEQRLLFETCVFLCRKYFPSVCAHLGGTYGALLGEAFAFDCVRVGLGLYGYLPQGEYLYTPTLERCMEIYAKTVSIGRYTQGGIGYGKANVLQGANELYVSRFGYADGFLRKKENGLLGAESNANNLCMDACIRYGKGRTGEWLPIMTDAEETARKTGTIPYEVLCAATRRAEFVYDYD